MKAILKYMSEATNFLSEMLNNPNKYSWDSNQYATYGGVVGAMQLNHKDGRENTSMSEIGNLPNWFKSPTYKLPNKASKYKEAALELAKLVEEKNVAYGNSFKDSAHFLKLLFPDGIPTDKYQDILLLVRVFDKLKRIATRKDAFGESPWKDITGYGLLGVVNDDTISQSNEPVLELDREICDIHNIPFTYYSPRNDLEDFWKVCPRCDRQAYLNRKP